MNEEKNSQQVDKNDGCCWTSGEPEPNQDRTDAITQKSKGQAGVRADVNGVGEVLDHGRVAGEFFPSVFQEQAQTCADAKNEKAGVGICGIGIDYEIFYGHR